LLRRRLGALLHLDEERVGLGLGNQADDDGVSAERGKRRAEQGELQEHLRVHRGRLRWKAVGGASSDTTTFPSWRRRSPGASCCRHNDSAVHYPVGELGRKPRGSVWNLFASRKPDGHPWRQRRFTMPKTSAYAATAARKPLEPYAIDRRQPGPRDVHIDNLLCA